MPTQGWKFATKGKGEEREGGQLNGFKKSLARGRGKQLCKQVSPPHIRPQRKGGGGKGKPRGEEGGAGMLKRDTKKKLSPGR